MLSYSIYMTHAAILWGFNQVLRAWIGRLAVGSDFENSVSPLVGTVLVLAFLGITLVVSRMTYTLIESPCRNWSKRVMSRASMAPSPKVREASR
jgi:peptidoglycan/LPS O-acetylase OafA/YrhL